MLTDESDIHNVVRFWIPVLIGVFLCVLIGRLAVSMASEWFVAFCFGLGAAVLTFYEPKLGLGLVVFSMLLSPRLRGGSIGGTSDAQGSSIEFRLDDILLPIIVAAWFARTAILKGESFLIRTPLHLPMFLYTFICVLSTGLAMMRGDIPVLRPIFFVLKYFEFFLLFFMTVNVVQKREEIQRYLFAGWIVALIVTLFGYAQIPSGERISTPFETPIGITSSAKVFKENESNTYGGYCLVIFGLLLANFTQGGARTSIPSILTFLFMLPPFFLTLSRSSYSGLSMMVLFILGASFRKRWQLAMGVMAIMIIMFMVPRIRDSVVKRVLYTFSGQGTATVISSKEDEADAGQRVKLEGSAQARVDAWKYITKKFFPRHPMLGSGVTGVGLVDVQYPRVLGEVGLIGLAVFIWLICQSWKLGWDVFRSGEDSLERMLGLGFMAVVIGLAIQSFAANTFIIVRIMEPFWFLAALCARVEYNRRLRFEGSLSSD